LVKESHLKKIVYAAAVLTFTFGFLFIGCAGDAPLRPVPPSPYDPAPSPTPAPSITQQLLDAHNKERAAHNLAPLKLNPKLQEAAQKHSDFQAKVGRMGHMFIGDGTPWTRIEATGYKYQGAGENVAWNQPDVATVMKDWMWSPGHRANILGAYTECGLAVTEGASGKYWTSDFGTPASVNAVTTVPEVHTATVTATSKSAASSTQIK
jgi:uncharacterized protein YkwD